MKKTIAILFLFIILVLGSWQPVTACTGIRLIAKDGTVIFARTLEFGTDLQSDVIMIPRGYSRVSTTPDGSAGLTWKSKYASVGANGVNLPFIFDGLNEKGVSVGTFYFPGTAGYMPYQASDAGKTLAPWEVGSWILENFASVSEVRNNIGKIVVPAVVFKAWGFVPPVHYIVNDSAGNSIVIEYVNGKLNIYDNPLGVMSNSPGFDWHLTNLRNYVNLSFINSQPVQLGSYKIESFGQGSGMLGIPGDFTPPSRFVRAVAFSQGVGAFPLQTGNDAVLQAFKILNNFDIPKGSVREGQKDANGNIVADYTLWTSANDLKTKTYYIRTYNNSQIRSAELMKMNLNGTDIVKLSLQGNEVIKSLLQ